VTAPAEVIAWLDDPVTHERLEAALHQTATRVKGAPINKKWHGRGAKAAGLELASRRKLHEYDAADLLLFLLREWVA
jgi:hypothetical protein